VVEPRTDAVAAERGLAQGETRKMLGDAGRPLLPQSLQEAASRSGYQGASSKVFGAKEAQLVAADDDAKRTSYPEIGSVVLDDHILRRSFAAFDLDRNDVVAAKELKHLFAQLGEMPKDSVIDGMIALCDLRGDGAVSYEDFLTVFANPAESLRVVNVDHIKDVVHGDRPEETEADEEEEMEEGEEEDEVSSSGSSLEVPAKQLDK